VHPDRQQENGPFALPMLQNLLETQTRTVRGSTRALVLAPTRELADQIGGCFSSDDGGRCQFIQFFINPSATPPLQISSL